MDIFVRLIRERQIVWEWVSQFLCWEYCVQLIDQNIPQDKYPKIEPAFFQQLVEYSVQDKSDFEFYRVLIKYLTLTNQLLEESSDDNVQSNIETCVDCLNEICSLFPELNYFCHHLNKLFQDIESDLCYEGKHKEWKSIFQLSQNSLLKEILELLPVPYILNFASGIDWNKADYNDDKSLVDKIVDFLKKLPIEKRSFDKVKELLLGDEIIKIALNENKLENNDVDSELSSDGSFKSVVSNFPDRLNNDDANKQDKDVEMYEDNSREKEVSQETLQQTNIENNENNLLVTTSYFQTPAPIPDLKTLLKQNLPKEKQSKSDEESENSVRCPSPASSVSSSRSYDGMARKRIPWTLEEEEFLVAGIQKYGVGHWKFILTDGGIQNRTPRDLYDKWKNIKKYGQLEVIKARLKKKIDQKKK